MLLFTAQVSATVGTYTNTFSATISLGSIESNPVNIGVGAPRLTIAKDVALFEDADLSGDITRGDTLEYTVAYATDSPINTAGVEITDGMPDGLTFLSATGPYDYNGRSRTITWTIGDLAAGQGPYIVTFRASVDDPFPEAVAIPVDNSARSDSNETDPAHATVSTYINAPPARSRRSKKIPT
jgi:uncharacterized repeat protein (TIGR01451 family)